MPRPKLSHQNKKFCLVMNKGVVDAFALATEDPLRDRPVHGKRAQIVEGFLRQWLKENGHEELLTKKLKEAERSE